MVDGEMGVELMREVTQSVLMEYLRLTAKAEFLKESIKASLEHGATVEKGDVIAKLQKSSRKTPKWKEELEKVVGKEQIDAIIAATPATDVVALKIDVKKNAMMQKEEA